MRIHQENIAADDTDVLAGTALDQLEAGGQLDVFALSTQADTLMSITGPDNEPIATGVELPQVTAGVQIDITALPTYSLGVRTGGHYTVNIDIVTGAVVSIIGIYRKRGVDF